MPRLTNLTHTANARQRQRLSKAHSRKQGAIRLQAKAHLAAKTMQAFFAGDTRIQMETFFLFPLPKKHDFISAFVC
jgi:hypothetical protein